MGAETRKTTLPSEPETATDSVGLEDGGSIRPGDTPPSEDSMSGAVGDAPGTPNHGPVSGNRTPMIIALSILGLIVLAVLGYGAAELIGYLRA
jgi:hypothetical protein